MLEVTYGFIKPDAYEKRTEIKEMISSVDLDINLEKNPYFFSEKTARNLYEPIQNEPWYDKPINLLTSGPTVQLLMSGNDAIRRLIDIVGDTDPRKALPNTIRGKYGTGLPCNAFHRSFSKMDVHREVLLIFSKEEIPQSLLRVLDTYSTT